MNIIDREFHQLTGELRRLSEKEIYHRMRNAFDLIPASTKRGAAPSSSPATTTGESWMPTMIYTRK